MLQRARLPSARLAIFLATLAILAGLTWLLTGGGGSGSTSELAGSQPPSSGIPPARSPGSGDGGHAQTERSRGRRDGDARNRDVRGGVQGERTGSPNPTPPRQREATHRSPEDEPKGLLGIGGGPEQSQSQSELPPEVDEFLQGSDEPEASQPDPEIEELLQQGGNG